MQAQKESFINLQDTLDQAQSASFVALPVSKVNIQGLLATAHAHGATGAEVESFRLQDFLLANKELATNLRPDVVVVRFPANSDAASTDALLGSAERTVSAATSGKYSSILSTTSNMDAAVATNLAFRFFAAEELRSSVPYIYQNGTTMPTTTRSSLMYGGSAYLTPTLLVAILVMIYMGVLALSA